MSGFSIQSVHHKYWSKIAMYCTVCGMVHMKDPLLLKGGVAHKVVVAIPLNKTIFPTS